MTARTSGAVPLADGISAKRQWTAVAGTDAAGLVGARIGFGRSEPPIDAIEITLNGLRRALVEPLLREIAWMLEVAEFFGRAACHLVTYALGEVYELRHDGLTTEVANVPLGGDLVVPSGLQGPDDSELPPELDALARRWVEDIARASGHFVLRGTYAE